MMKARETFEPSNRRKNAQHGSRKFGMRNLQFQSRTTTGWGWLSRISLGKYDNLPISFFQSSSSNKLGHWANPRMTCICSSLYAYKQWFCSHENWTLSMKNVVSELQFLILELGILCFEIHLFKQNMRRNHSFRVWDQNYTYFNIH